METAIDPGERPDPARRRAEWLRYYSFKRVQQQMLQMQMLRGREVDSVLEIGPYLGLVTAMLDNAGYRVTTLDLGPRSFDRPDVPHVEMDLTRPDPAHLAGYDCIFCCETLEHIGWDEASAALRTFREAAPRYLLLSVPYNGFRLYLNGVVAGAAGRRFSLFVKWPMARRRFVADIEGDPYGHKWEIGYRGYPLRRWEDTLKTAGFEIVERAFSAPTWSVFHMLRPA